eukprot:177009-Chlamydomonas_euryale.AAC.1
MQRSAAVRRVAHPHVCAAAQQQPAHGAGTVHGLVTTLPWLLRGRCNLSTSRSWEVDSGRVKLSSLPTMSSRGPWILGLGKPVHVPSLG